MAGQSADQIRKEITTKMVDAIKGGTIPWRKPWIAGQGGGMPWNFQSKRRYTGINVLILFLEGFVKGYISRNWGTANSWLHNSGLQVKKGEKSTYVTFYSKFDKRDPVTKKVIMKADGKPEQIFVMRVYSVFNAEQVMAPTVETLLGTPRAKSILAQLLGEVSSNKINKSQLLTIGNKYLPRADRPSMEMTIEEMAQSIHDGLNKVHQKYLVTEVQANSDPDYEPAEQLITASGADIRYTKGGDKAAYNRLTDKIVLPGKKSFRSMTDFYQTAFHELGHWASHPSRVGEKKFDKEEDTTNVYAWNELVAEMSACFTLMELGVPLAEEMLPKSAAYLMHWLGKMGDNPKYIFEAATWASKTTDYLLGLVGKANPSYDKDDECSEDDEVAMREAA